MPAHLERAFVWGGGALFIGSLALTVWLFADRFGALHPFGGWQPLVVNALVFTLFALHHSLFSRQPVKHAMTALVPERLLRSVYVWIASALLIFVGLAWQPVGGLLYASSGAAAVMLAAVQLAGLAMVAGAVRAIHPLELAGIRPSAAHEQLQIGGVYGLVRHPLYLGWVLMVWGATTMTGDRIAFAALTTVYLLMAVPWEERSLEQNFGEEYRAYRHTVRWRVIPGIY